MFDLFRPPEWDYWRTRDKVAYLISLVIGLSMLGLGVWKLKELLGG